MLRRDSRWFLLGLLGFGFLAACCLPGCGSGAHANTPTKPKEVELPTIRAAVLRIEPTNWPAVVRTQGSLMADEVTIVGAKVAGRINEIRFDFGDAVKANAVLASLDQEDFKLEVSLADAQLSQSRAALGLRPGDPAESLDPQNAPPVREAKAVWDETRTRVARVRQLQLHTRNTVTQEELDQAVAAEGAADARQAAAVNAVREKIAQIKVRESELHLAQQRLADTVIHAPMDGLVRERHVAHGSFVQLGDPIATLVRTSIVRFRGTMPERHAHRLALGQRVTLKIEGVPEPREAQVTRISPTVDEMSRALTFEALVNNADGSLRTGLFAEAEVVVDPNATALVVPDSAVMEFAGSEKVWKVVDGLAKEQVIDTARHDPRGIEVLGRLKPGDVILLNAMEGRVAHVEPIYAAPVALDSNGAGSADIAAAGEGLEPAAGGPAAADHGVSR